MRLTFIFPLLFVVSATTGCSTHYLADTSPITPSNKTNPSLNVSIDSLSPCTDGLDTSLKLDPNKSVTILVHGCDSSAGRFRQLAQLYAFHDQQAVCYNYDDRKSLKDAAETLAKATDELGSKLNNQDITVVGHSMGGLVSRRAFEQTPAQLDTSQEIDLVTVSAPIAGIQAANTCGIKPLHWLSLGVVPGICWIITGDNWTEITANSPFIQQPSELTSNVNRYVKIVTDETNTCRRKNDNGDCIESDYVFNVSEQYHPVIDQYPQLTNIQVNAGHVAIVGDDTNIPRQLISILQQQGIMPTTPEARQAAFEKLLTEIYLEPNVTQTIYSAP
ncbi:alpha/beta hydrolase [Shewanella maritima]|uniref:Alpha/beta hydrolase n=1 Tax=Shewanella maritima TaxID=2520507 RepID=A0A411PMF7_9GAMM|nr:alpha/beta hydrolase [Shewanella maritima]QBF84668.1 alpha/beta hydrolase [Shewanella maritima]